MPKPATYPTLLDETKQISMSKLKEWGYLDWRTDGLITWSRGEVKTGSINISANPYAGNQYVELSYTYRQTEEVKYQIPLVSVPSNLGNGVVWYFFCPFAQKRCRKLYCAGKYFVHREAFQNAMYECQTHTKRWRRIKSVLVTLDLVEGINSEIYRKYGKLYYKGKPTKRLERILRLQERVNSVNQMDIESLFI
jgi:hypothetical protein